MFQMLRCMHRMCWHPCCKKLAVGPDTLFWFFQERSNLQMRRGAMLDVCLFWFFKHNHCIEAIVDAGAVILCRCRLLYLSVNCCPCWSPAGLEQSSGSASCRTSGNLLYYCKAASSCIVWSFSALFLIDFLLQTSTSTALNHLLL